MTTTRREFVIATGAALATARATTGATVTDQDANAGKLLADMAEELLVDYPESATALGIDVQARAALKSRVTNLSAGSNLSGVISVTGQASKRKMTKGIPFKGDKSVTWVL